VLEQGIRQNPFHLPPNCIPFSVRQWHSAGCRRRLRFQTQVRFETDLWADCGKLVGDEATAVEQATIFKTRAADDPALAEVVRRLVEAYQPERIYLFGSVARGDAGADSDYDLLVVAPDDAALERRRSRLAYEALRGTGTAADVVVCTRSYFEDRRLLKASLPGTVLREGRLLHGA